MNIVRKPILALDFDGVLHSYSSRWQRNDIIPDPPIDGAIEFLKVASETFEINIFSTRSNGGYAIPAMQRWLWKYAYEKYGNAAYDWYMDIIWALEKPPAHVLLDDRAMTFTGVFPDIQTLIDFEPWNRRDV